MKRGVADMYKQLRRLIDSHEHVAVISHFRPDGDAIGSTLALGLALKGLGKRVSMWNEDGVPARYAFLAGAEEIAVLPEALPGDVDLVICVDTGARKRLGDRAEVLLADFPALVNVDHHESNSHYGHLNVVEANTAACGYVLYKMLKSWGDVELTPAIATALYVAISTDTGSFQYSSTTADVLHVTAELVEAGVDVADVNRRVYQELPLTSLLVQREVLNNMVVEEHGTMSHYSMPAGTKQRLGVGLEDTKDLVDVVRVVEGVKVAAIFEDLEDGRIRISLRSKDAAVSVAKIAEQFGGGGHAMASGIRMSGTLEDVRSRVLAAIRNAINENCSHE